MRFFEVTGPDPWGDYGRVLISGMTAHLPPLGGKLQLERAGPYMPPITFPGLSDVVVTDVFRRQLESAGLGRLKFQSVVKARIVNLPWETWDRTADEAPLALQRGEPEDHILRRRHSEQAAEAMGDVWQVLLKDGLVVHSNAMAVSEEDIDRMLSMLQGGPQVEITAPPPPTVYVESDTWNGEHFIYGKFPKAGRVVVASEIGKGILERLAGEWVRFEPLDDAQ